ncbi:PREDICTED: cucumber peeling cupredoxin-like [Populus euphratica]|uniref:Cucumber peeling cupredoxin-like n=1 Tax=Populus euphratica TaxID=75702 RepID=A0AAJ6TV81_POPEU|nr:PREDICTED: cucumber peeling cupredoxin-like [Populus euphratica]
MARGLDMAFLAAIAVAALIHSSAAQSTYTVGDTTGWTIPSTGSAFYTTWAASKNFSVGDILVFNFAASAHDVAKVTKADYDACTTSSPISLTTTPPARITINASGDHYFLCNFPGHCSSGQKLMINVSAASSSPSPAPQPSTPAPQPSTPAPQPSTPAPQPSTPTPQSSPAPQPSTPTPSSSPSPVSTPPPTPASSPSPPPATTPSSSPPSPPTTTPPTAPPPNSATSLGLAGFTTFLSIFVALCY